MTVFVISNIIGVICVVDCYEKALTKVMECATMDYVNANKDYSTEWLNTTCLKFRFHHMADSVYRYMYIEKMEVQ